MGWYFFGLLWRLIYGRKHAFYPAGTVQAFQFQWPYYCCERCHKQLHLAPWQMDDLPVEMAYGCKGDNHG